MTLYLHERQMMWDSLQEGMKKGLEEGRKEGIKEGRAEGIKQGMKEGRAEGIKEGIKEGRAEGDRSAIKKMLTKLTPDEIVELGYERKLVMEISGEILHSKG